MPAVTRESGPELAGWTGTSVASDGTDPLGVDTIDVAVGLAFGDGVGFGVGEAVGRGVGLGVGFGVMRGVGVGDGLGVTLGDAVAEADGLGVGVGDGVGVGLDAMRPLADDEATDPDGANPVAPAVAVPRKRRAAAASVTATAPRMRRDPRPSRPAGRTVARRFVICGSSLRCWFPALVVSRRELGAPRRHDGASGRPCAAGSLAVNRDRTPDRRRYPGPAAQARAHRPGRNGANW